MQRVGELLDQREALRAAHAAAAGDDYRGLGELGPRFGELYVSSNRRDEVQFPKRRDTAATLQQRLQQPLNGSRNLWRFDIADVLRAHGVTD